MPCSAAERSETCRAPIAGCASQRLDLLLLGQASQHVLGASERVLQLGEPLDEARPALEELGELVRAQLPR